VNVALRAVHDALATKGDPSATWRSLIGALAGLGGTERSVEARELQAVLRSIGCGGTSGEWMANLRLLAVVDADQRIDARRADSVATALELAADSFSALGAAPSWAPVATLPNELRMLLRLPPLRHTAGVLLDLVDRATREIRLAAPFVDADAVDFLADSLVGAGRRSVSVDVITSVGQGIHFVKLAQRWNAEREVRGRLRISEVKTHLSSLGSHAKVLVVDSQRGYVGSANLTAAGLGRHVEIGVELAGAQVAELTSVLAALDRAGSTTLTAGR
jgi:phosphatidylserine/phosphatidylglycerophosphate/cardiolipin synthase-like enzyme